MMVDTKKTEDCSGTTRWANHHPEQSVTMEVIATKDMATSGRVRTSEVETEQGTTTTMVTLYLGFPEERIKPQCCYLNYLCEVILLWKYGHPHPVKSTLKNQRKTQKVPMFSARFQLSEFLICSSQHPVLPWIMTTNGTSEGGEKAPPWQPRLHQVF